MQASRTIQERWRNSPVTTSPQTRETIMNAAPATQNETADIGFFRNIGFAFIVLTAIAGSMTIGLILQQTSTSAPTAIATAQ
jgi:hypothetical protein